MTLAKKAVDSTLKKILLHAAEILASIILLVVICLPLVFVIPMWLQQIGLGTPVSGLLVNPVAWFGIAGAIAVTLAIAVAAGVLGYAYVSVMAKPRKKGSEAAKEETPELEEAPLEEEVPEPSAPEVEPVEATDEEADLSDEEAEDAMDESDEV